MSRLREYYILTKPGIIKGNSLAAIAGFLLASATAHEFRLGAFTAMLTGLALIIASGCAFNNLIDRNIDRKMNRTKKRPSVTGSISAKKIIVFATLLGFSGTAILWLFTNTLATLLALFGHFAYVVVYGFWKRRSVYGTEVGSISGAIPPVVGYCAASGSFDLGALLLFLIMVFWQMPHFFAIAMFRAEDYRAAGIPVLPVKRGMGETKKRIIFYIMLYIISAILLTLFGYTGYIFLAAVLVLGGYWVLEGVKGFRSGDDIRWSKKMFGHSLLNLTAISILIPLGALLP